MSDHHIHHHFKPTFVQHQNPDNGFAWERLDLEGWREGAGRAEWDIEWEAMKAVTLYRGGR